MLSTRDYKSLTDTELVSQYRGTGNLGLLGELYSRYTSLVYGVCMKYLKDREESKDAVMQLFEKLVVSLREHEVTHFKSWLYVSARNYCLMQLRSRKGRHLLEISGDLMESDAFLHPDDEPEMESNLSKLERCIEQLGTEQKACVHLFYIKQKCYKEIVDLTGFDDNKVKSYIQNGKRNLKICMDQKDE